MTGTSKPDHDSERPATASGRDLLLVQTSSVQVAPDQMANTMLHPDHRGMHLLLVAPQYVATGDGREDTKPLVAAAPPLGLLLGLIEARIAERDQTTPGTAARYLAAKDEGSASAARVPSHARRRRAMSVARRRTTLDRAAAGNAGWALLADGHGGGAGIAGRAPLRPVPATLVTCPLLAPHAAAHEGET